MKEIESKMIIAKVQIDMNELDEHFDELTNLMLTASALGAATGSSRLAIIAQAALNPPEELTKNIEQYYIIFGMLGGIFRMIHEGQRDEVEELAGPKIKLTQDIFDEADRKLDDLAAELGASVLDPIPDTIN